MTQRVHIIGGGLAGSEAAWQLASRGFPVTIHEMRPTVSTPAHQTETLAELVCSNSFRSDDAERSAIGLLHQEMRKLNSIILRCADANQVPAGGALAVDRNAFSVAVQTLLEKEPLIKIERDEITNVSGNGWERVIIATGPLTSNALAKSIGQKTGEDSLAFFDAIAPIVYKDTIDFNTAWFQSRYDKGTGSDYINCPLSEDQYNDFVLELERGKKTEFKDWEKETPYFEGCLPIEVMASRGRKTLAFGPMKPVGLTNPHTPGERPFAVVQLRQDNALGTLYNIVGFQTKLRYEDQKRIFRMIPGLKNARFARLGGIHRNTFINSPRLLDQKLRLKVEPKIRFAGQITGCEGYVESAAVGLLAGLFTSADIAEADIILPPQETAIGALLAHITGDFRSSIYQPMNVNFGLFPEPEERTRKRDRKAFYTNRAREHFEQWLKDLNNYSLFAPNQAV